AAAQGQEVGAQPHLVKLIEIEITVAQANPRKHRIVRAEASVSGDVNQPALRRQAEEERVVHAVPEMELGVSKHFVNSLDFRLDERRLRIGNSQDERTC